VANVLRRSKKNLKDLLIFLGVRVGPMKTIRLKHSEDQDDRNAMDTRAFCHVIEGKREIHCTKYLDDLPLEARLGVLLHEIGHIEAEAFVGEECEVDADLWVKESVPECDLKYTDVRYKRGGRIALAMNLQTVSRQFAEIFR